MICRAHEIHQAIAGNCRRPHLRQRAKSNRQSPCPLHQASATRPSPSGRLEISSASDPPRPRVRCTAIAHHLHDATHAPRLHSQMPARRHCPFHQPMPDTQIHRASPPARAVSPHPNCSCHCVQDPHSPPLQIAASSVRRAPTSTQRHQYQAPTPRPHHRRPTASSPDDQATAKNHTHPAAHRHQAARE